MTLPHGTRPPAGTPHRHRRNDGRCRWPQWRRAEYRGRCPAVTATAHRRSATVSFAGPPGRRVRHRLTPTKRGRWRQSMAHNWPTSDAAPDHPCRGEALPRPPHHGHGNSSRPAARTAIDNDTALTIGTGLPPSGPAGQALPDPYQTGIAPTRHTRMPDRGRMAYPCRGDALRRPARPFGAANPRHTPASNDRNATPPTGRDMIPGPPGRRVRQRLTPTGGSRAARLGRVSAAPPTHRPILSGRGTV